MSLKRKEQGNRKSENVHMQALSTVAGVVSRQGHAIPRAVGVLHERKVPAPVQDQNARSIYYD